MSAPEPTRPQDTTPVVSPVASGGTVTPLHAHTRVGALEPVPDHRSVRSVASVVATVAKPPALWSEARPSLADVWAYGRRGQYAGETGIWRVLGQIYAAFVIGATFAGYFALWVIQHPARLAVATVVLVLARLSF